MNGIITSVESKISPQIVNFNTRFNVELLALLGALNVTLFESTQIMFIGIFQCLNIPL